MTEVREFIKKLQDKEFNIRSSNTADIPRIIELLKGFEFPLTKAHYTWEYLTSPWGSVATVAEVEGEIIGHFGYIIRPFLIDNQLVNLGIENTNCSLYGWQDRGRRIFSRISREKSY